MQPAVSVNIALCLDGLHPCGRICHDDATSHVVGEPHLSSILNQTSAQQPHAQCNIYQTSPHPLHHCSGQTMEATHPQQHFCQLDAVPESGYSSILLHFI